MLVIAGLSPTTGVDGDLLLRGTIAPFEVLAADHRVTVVNRRPNLPRGISFAQIAAEHADAIRDGLGGSRGRDRGLDRRLDRPAAGRRPSRRRRPARAGQHRLPARGVDEADAAQVAARIRAGAPRRAMAVMAADLVPPWRGRTVAGIAALLAGPRVLQTDHDLDDLATTIEAEDTFDLAHCARPIAARTLIVAGAEDRFYPRALLDQTARADPRRRAARARRPRPHHRALGPALRGRADRVPAVERPDGHTLKLQWTAGEGFELENERDYHAAIVALLQDGVWRTADTIRAEVKAGANRVKELLETDRFVMRNGEDAKALGQHPNRKLYQLAEFVDSTASRHQLTPTGQGWPTAGVNSPTRL